MLALFIIPTRNRADLAIEALESAFRSKVRPALVVSDNSDADQMSVVLENACVALGATYVRPPSVMAMPEHWEWALGQGLVAVPAATHVAFLTDRMLLKRGALDRLFALAESEPEFLISWSHDKIDDARRPVVLHQEEGTRRVYRIDSQHLINLAARSILPQCLPRMMNSLAPVSVVNGVRTRFSKVFGSVSPDYVFAFRALEVCDTILFLDQPLMAHRAQLHSNGESYARGRGAEAEMDFAEHLRSHGVAMNHATPMPEVRSIVNAMLNEYCVVLHEVGPKSRFPPLDMSSYIRALHHDIELIESPEAREYMRSQLPVQEHTPVTSVPIRMRARRAIQQVSARPRLATLFRELQRRGLRPTAGPWTRFSCAEDAMRFLEDAPRPAPAWPYHMHDVLDGSAVIETPSDNLGRHRYRHRRNR
jgi:hypothetical protein